MNIALIIAGGVGARMHQAVPKQFMSVNDKPIIVYTLERFQQHPLIDTIAVVCLHGWDVVLSSYAKQYGISKLEHIIEAGNVGQQSIKNGLDALALVYPSDSWVLIHDAIRPMVSAEIITDCINVALEKGNAVTCIPCQEAMMISANEFSAQKAYPRSQLKRSQTPQCFKLGDLLDAHRQAQIMGIDNSISSCTLYTEVGKEIFISKGSEKNIKITTQDDLDIFKALLNLV